MGASMVTFILGVFGGWLAATVYWGMSLKRQEVKYGKAVRLLLQASRGTVRHSPLQKQSFQDYIANLKVVTNE